MGYTHGSSWMYKIKFVTLPVLCTTPCVARIKIYGTNNTLYSTHCLCCNIGAINLWVWRIADCCASTHLLYTYWNSCDSFCSTFHCYRSSSGGTRQEISVPKTRIQLKTDSKAWLFVCGFLSGVFGGAYGINGPPLIIYGNLRNWSAQHFRATLQSYFLVASTVGMLGYWYKGLWSSTVNYYFLLSLPVILPTIFLGRYLNRRLKDNAFLKYVYVGLICIGMVLLKQSIF